MKIKHSTKLLKTKFQYIYIWGALGHHPNAPQCECPSAPHLTKVCLHTSIQIIYITCELVLATYNEWLSQASMRNHNRFKINQTLRSSWKWKLTCHKSPLEGLNKINIYPVFQRSSVHIEIYSNLSLKSVLFYKFLVEI